MTTRPRTSARRGAASTLVVAALLVCAAAGPGLVPAAAAVSSAPGAGPTAGGTLVGGDVPAPNLSRELVDLASVGGHVVGTSSDGRVYGWGYNLTGQLGDGTTTDATAPVLVQAPEGVVFSDVAMSGHGVATGSDGNLYAWGENRAGELGSTSAGAWSSVPVVADAAAGLELGRAAAGDHFTLALTADGTAYGWGSNTAGELGNPSAGAASSVPVEVQMPDGVTITSISAKHNHVLAVGSDGAVYGWGANSSGKLGIGRTGGQVTVPTRAQVPAGVEIVEVQVGFDHSLALTADGDVYAWGLGQTGQLGASSPASSNVPVRIAAPAGVVFTSIAAGSDHSVALTPDGTVYTWGFGSSGQLGTGDQGNRFVPVPVPVPDGVRFSSIAASNMHTVATGDDGTYSWGANSYGQLGDGTTTGSLVPVELSWPDVVVSEVTFGGAPGDSLVHDAATWSVTTPAHACGVTDVVVETVEFGTSFETGAGQFAFGEAPAVTVEPTSVVLQGGTSGARLSAVSSGDPAPDVQWQQSAPGSDTWTDVPGATTATTTVDLDRAADLRAVFSNCLGTVTSEVAQVTFAPTLVGTPPSGTVGEVYPAFGFELTGDPLPTVVVSDGVLPDGLELDPKTGVIAGTPTTAGVVDLVVTASNGAGPDASLAVSITVAAAAVPEQPTPGPTLPPTTEPVAPPVQPAPAPAAPAATPSPEAAVEVSAEPAGLAVTGAQGILWGLLAAVLAIAGGILLRVRRSRDS